MDIIVIIACVLFIGYLIASMEILKQIPPSISDTFYMYNKKRTGLGYVFTLFMVAEAFLMVTPMVELSVFEWWQFISFFCPAMIGFCGCAPLFKNDDLNKRVHFFGAISAAVLGLVWCCLMNVAITVAILAALASVVAVVSDVTLTWKSCRTFWLEIIAFGTIAVSLLAFTY